MFNRIYENIEMIKTLRCNKPIIINAEIKLPASKSISNRLLIIKALSQNKFVIDNLSQANDTLLLQNILRELNHKPTQEIRNIDAQDAGTVFRFLTAYLSRTKGKFLLRGSERMQKRPIGILVDALRKLGAQISYLNQEGFPPLLIEGRSLTSKPLKIQSNISSQFITALLLIAPLLPKGLKIEFEQKPSSFPYILMTLRLMQTYGIELEYNEAKIEVSPGNYITKNISIESDWSAAAFWYQSLAFSNNGQLLLKGLNIESIQGDSILPGIYTQFGIKTTKLDKTILIKKEGAINYNFNFDFSQHPDLALPLIATCAGLGIIGKFTGLESLKIKESNRVKVLETELSKLGFDFRETGKNEWVLINSCKVEKPDYDFSDVIINTYEDHRVAMSFAPFCLIGKGIQIKNPSVINKSFPNYWQEFKKLTTLA